MLHRERIGSCSLHMLEGDAQVRKRACLVIALQALDCPLKPEGAKVDELPGSDGGMAHCGNIVPAGLPGNLHLMS